MSQLVRVVELDDGDWQLSSDFLKVRVNASQGADVRSIVHVASGTELLWTDEGGAPVGPMSPASDFYDRYPGGIQELFPNAGPACEVHGAPLVFHGESCRIPWTASTIDRPGGIDLICRARLRRYPFAMERVFSLSRDAPHLEIRSKVTNLSAAQLPVHWGFHPAFSAELTAAPATLLGEFTDASAEKGTFGSVRRWMPDAAIPFETSLGFSALQLTPAEAGCADLGYASAGAGWYVLRSGAADLSVGVTWPVDIFPKVWIWQECHDPGGYPWWGRHHIVAIEPHTSAPSRSLEDDIDAGDAVMIGGGMTLEARFGIRVSLGDESATAELLQSVRETKERR